MLVALAPHSAFAEFAGTKGQNYDRIVFDTATDEEVQIVAKVMTINRYADSASTVVVTDNGVTALGPERESTERWTRKIAVRGKGRHEVVMICGSIESDPVHCSLDPDDARISVAQ